MRTREATPTLSSLALLAARYRRTPGMPEYLRRVARKHGAMVRFRGVGPAVWLASDPAAVEDVLVAKAAAFEKGRGTRLLRMLLGQGLLTAEPPEHLVHRRLVQPAFRRDRIADYARVMVASTRAMVDGWRDGEVIEIDRATNALALDIAARALFGAALDAPEAARLSTALESAMRDFPYFMLPMSERWSKLPLPIVRRFEASKRTIDGVVDRMVRAHRAEPSASGDVMATLIAARDDDMRGGMSDAQVRDEAMTILLAGHETTANALAWTFYLLQRHPDVEARLEAQLRDVLGEREPTIEDVARLDFARAVFAEALRLYPPAWITARRATAVVDVGGRRVRAGELVLVSPYVVQRDPRFWREPERFDPARFLDGMPSPRYAYFPFGGGTRLCIGESFAWTEGVLAIAVIASRVRLARTNGDEVATAPLVTLRPRSPIYARVERRAP